MRTRALLAIAVWVLAIKVSHGQEIYAGTIHWMPTGNNNELTFKYTLVWSSSSLPCSAVPNCTDILIANVTTVLPTGRLPGSRWSCVAGCTGFVISDLGDMVFTSVDSLKEDSWETGAGTFTHQFLLGSDHSLNASIMLTNYSSSNGILGAEINLDKRNDTNRPNVSPAVGILPVYRVQFGCSTNISIFSFDGDGDKVRCGWPANGATVASPKPILDEERCTLLFETSAANGFVKGELYVYDLVLEDYSEEKVKLENSSRITNGPLSRVPLRMTVRIIDVASTCDEPSFPGGNMRNGLTASFTQLPIHKSKLSYKLQGQSSRIVSSGLRRLLFSTNVTGSNMVISGLWTINDTEIIGINTFCAAVYTNSGTLGEQRCIVLLVEDPNECSSRSACHSGEVCTNLWQYYKCFLLPTTSTTSTTVTTTSTSSVTVTTISTTSTTAATTSALSTTVTSSTTPTTVLATAPTTPSTGTDVHTSTKSVTSQSPLPTASTPSLIAVQMTTSIQGQTSSSSAAVPVTQSASNVTGKTAPVVQSEDDNIGMKAGLPIGLLLIALLLALLALLYRRLQSKKEVKPEEKEPVIGKEEDTADTQNKSLPRPREAWAGATQGTVNGMPVNLPVEHQNGLMVNTAELEEVPHQDYEEGMLNQREAWADVTEANGQNVGSPVVSHDAWSNATERNGQNILNRLSMVSGSQQEAWSGVTGDDIISDGSSVVPRGEQEAWSDDTYENEQHILSESSLVPQNDPVLNIEHSLNDHSQSNGQNEPELFSVENMTDPNVPSLYFV